jgi:hypothetical protein
MLASDSEATIVGFAGLAMLITVSLLELNAVVYA